MERVKRVAIPHENAAEIGVILEANAHHVVDLALVPICGGPKIRDGCDLGIILGNLGPNPEMDAVTIPVEFIDHFEPRVAAPTSGWAASRASTVG